MTAKDVLDFWFGALTPKNWFAKDDAVDAEVRARFLTTYHDARAGKLDGWARDASGALALAIVLDQFPRNMFRGSAGAFDSDAQARRVAGEAIDDGFDRQLPAEERQFLYLPFMHSERLADQERGIALYEALGDEDTLRFARAHHDIVARFGHFPHRNAALGRATTPEEAAFLKTHKGF